MSLLRYALYLPLVVRHYTKEPTHEKLDKYATTNFTCACCFVVVVIIVVWHRAARGREKERMNLSFKRDENDLLL